MCSRVHATMPTVTEVLTVDALLPDPAAIARAAAILRGGGLVAFPTETVYGLGAHALDRAAVRRIFISAARTIWVRRLRRVNSPDWPALGRTKS